MQQWRQQYYHFRGKTMKEKLSFAILIAEISESSNIS